MTRTAPAEPPIPRCAAPQPPPLATDLPFLELDWLAADPALQVAVRDCVAAMRAAAAPRMQQFAALNADLAEGEAAADRLAPLLASGRDVHGIAEDPKISTVLVFNDRRYADGITSAAVTASRARVDALVQGHLTDLLSAPEPLACIGSGTLLYAPGSHMGWHTNAKKPGWRLMLTWAEQPGRSFFRYRHPLTGDIHTAWDQGLNARLLNIREQPPLWHAVFAGTWRYTLGYLIYPAPRRSLLQRVSGRLRRLFD